jgi:hypothetical protein
MRYLIVLLALATPCFAQSTDTTLTQGNSVIFNTGTTGSVTMNSPATALPWRLVTQLYDGEITVHHFATREECEDHRKTAEHQPVTLEERAYSAYFAKKDLNANVSQSYAHVGTDVAHAECLDW